VTPKLLVASRDPGDAAWLRGCLEERAEIVAAASLDEVLARAAAASVIAIGDQLADATADDLIDRLDAGGLAAPRVRLGEPRRIAPDPRIAFVLSRQLPAAEAAALVTSLAGIPADPAPVPQRPRDPDEARRRERAFTASRKIAAAADLVAAERAVELAMFELIAADRAYCLYVDGGSGELWSAERMAGDGDDRLADRGVAGWAARTGGTANVARAGDDPRWASLVDDPEGRGDERLLVRAVRGAGGEAHAVLVLARGAARPAFDAADAAALDALAGFAGPLLEQLARHVEAGSFLEEARGEPLFRREAVVGHDERGWGEVVRVAPPWIGWAYWGLVVVLVGAAVLVTCGRIATYSSGPAVVRMQDRREIASPTAGNVASVRVGPGAAVAAGEVLARLDDRAELADVARLERELATRLRERLLAPSDPATGEAVARLRLELERASAALDERVLRAPIAGVVGDVRVRAGQRVEPGDVVASIVDAAGGAEVIALLPGGDRPRLRPGQRMRLELHGFRHTYQDLTVEVVAAEAMGPEEARRYLGRIADDVAVRGPVVIVRATLPADFVADGAAYRYVDGMSGVAEVEIDSERILEALLPGSKRL
jgi:membrane fusion protein (multidrug efflux system)